MGLESPKGMTKTTVTFDSADECYSMLMTCRDHRLLYR